MKIRHGRLFLICLHFLSVSLFADEKALEGTSDVERLRKGEVLAEGSYVGRDVVGRMRGVIDAAPSLVWEIFIEADRWLDYRMPTLIDSRIVPEEVARKSADSKSVRDFYKVLGSQVFPVEPIRKKGGEWEHLAFQYYDVPWPVRNRWMILRTRDNETKAKRGNFRAVWSRAAGNINTIEGYFLLTPFEGNRQKTLLEYYVKTDPGAHVPRFMIRWGVELIMPEVIKAIRREATRRVATRRVATRRVVTRPPSPASQRPPSSSGSSTPPASGNPPRQSPAPPP